MKLKTAIIICGLLTLIGLIQDVYFDSKTPMPPPYFTIIAMILTVVLIFRHGTLKNNTIIIRIISISIGIIFIGELFKILHYPGANIFLFSGIVSISLAYLVHFIKKTDKQMLDFIKVIWVCSFCLFMLVAFFHLNYRSELKVIESMLFILLLIVFVNKNYNSELSA